MATNDGEGGRMSTCNCHHSRGVRGAKGCTIRNCLCRTTPSEWDQTADPARKVKARQWRPHPCNTCGGTPVYHSDGLCCSCRTTCVHRLAESGGPGRSGQRGWA